MATLTYCTNVHPGATLAEVERSLEAFTVPVADAVRGATASFPVGLYVSAATADELGDAARARQFGEFLAERRLHVGTFNCFPFGGFHAQRVKHEVYRPDWRDRGRVEFTLAAARAAAALAPAGATVPISTLAGSCKSFGDAAADHSAIARHLGEVAAALARLQIETGREIVLCLEPEPFTTLETCDEAVAFFSRQVWAAAAPARAAYVAAGGDAARAELDLRRHLGLCYDTCHQAVEFEDADAAIARLVAAELRIGKVQLSSAIATRSDVPRAETIAALRCFVEPRWLHQSFVRAADGRVAAAVDLEAGIAAFERLPAGAELRTHFHVPIDRLQFGALGTTRADLVAAVGALRRHAVPALFEVETYTFPALPAAVEPRELVAALTAELQFAAGVLRSK